MTPEPYRQIERLYQEALGLADGTERSTFVETACEGDEGLLREVQSLLSAHVEIAFEPCRPFSCRCFYCSRMRY
jgi:hypothetical protein